MKPIEQLIADTSGIALVKEWATNPKNKIEFLPVDKAKARETLYHLQITTRSPMGAITYFTGGILIENGWIRILGSGSEKLKDPLYHGIKEKPSHKLENNPDIYW